MVCATASTRRRSSSSATRNSGSPYVAPFVSTGSAGGLMLAGFAALTDKTGEGSRSQHISKDWNDDALEEDVAAGEERDQGQLHGVGLALEGGLHGVSKLLQDGGSFARDGDSRRHRGRC